MQTRLKLNWTGTLKRYLKWSTDLYPSSSTSLFYLVVWKWKENEDGKEKKIWSSPHFTGQTRLDMSDQAKHNYFFFVGVLYAN